MHTTRLTAKSQMDSAKEPLCASCIGSRLDNEKEGTGHQVM